MKNLIVPFTRRLVTRTMILSTLMIALPLAVFGQSGAPQDPATLIAQQRQAMTPLAFLNGVWRGPGWIVLPSGEKITFSQTERIGPFLDGSVKVMDGRSYTSDGKLIFNAFAILSYDSGGHSYSMRSYAQGRTGDFHFTPTAKGYTWEIPAGPMTIRYTAAVKGGVLHEVGERILPGKEPIQFFEMNVRRVGDTDWPNAGAIGPQ
ncbi:MAG TPA: hypothetical protein VMF56_12750 [Acidobacteriaceae bacterium]|nr:hypothetical protein [Acidobacteriaceae bacterium]